MHIKTSIRQTLLIVAIIGSSISLSHAGVVSGASVFAGSPGLGSASVGTFITFNPSNDNQSSGGSNLIVPFADFDSNEYIDTQFTVESSRGVTEYEVVLTVDNSTGTTWEGFALSLGYGVGQGFESTASGDGLDFDSPNFDPPASSQAFSTTIAGEKTLNFSGGSEGPGAKFVITLWVDVPNLTNGTFTLRQSPVPAIPEPSSFALGASSLFALSIARRLRRFVGAVER